MSDTYDDVPPWALELAARIEENHERIKEAAERKTAREKAAGRELADRVGENARRLESMFPDGDDAVDRAVARNGSRRYSEKWDDTFQIDKLR